MLLISLWRYEHIHSFIIFIDHFKTSNKDCSLENVAVFTSTVNSVFLRGCFLLNVAFCMTLSAVEVTLWCCRQLEWRSVCSFLSINCKIQPNLLILLFLPTKIDELINVLSIKLYCTQEVKSLSQTVMSFTLMLVN